MRQTNAGRLPCRKHNTIITTVRIKYSLARVRTTWTVVGAGVGWLTTTTFCRKMLQKFNAAHGHHCFPCLQGVCQLLSSICKSEFLFGNLGISSGMELELELASYHVHMTDSLPHLCIVSYQSCIHNSLSILLLPHHSQDSSCTP